ncbi:hypothetical protein AAVH_19895 [Aphelenchoides avenae]|nr:hypothetical protein AAVH_19895 [Aphelenchus avenae]
MFRFAVALAVIVCAIHEADACYKVIGRVLTPEHGTRLHKCVMGKGVSDLDGLKYSNAVLECLNRDTSNVDCCKAEGVSRNCLRLCNGTVPQNIASTDDFDALAKCPKNAFKCLDFGLYA